jgi:hypothetical protein
MFVKVGNNAKNICCYVLAYTEWVEGENWQMFNYLKYVYSHHIILLNSSGLRNIPEIARQLSFKGFWTGYNKLDTKLRESSILGSFYGSKYHLNIRLDVSILETALTGKVVHNSCKL